MFRFICFGEKAGSGADIIAKGWEENHWARPTIKDSYFPSEETELILDLLKEGGQTGGQTSGQTSSQTSGQTTEKVYELIKNDPYITRTRLSEILGISPSAIQKHVDKLKVARIRRVDGERNGGHWEIIDK